MRTVQFLTRRRTVMAAVAMGFAGRAANAQAPAEADPWPSLAEQIFGKEAIADGRTVLAIDAPYRAEDAAVVPVRPHVRCAAEVACPTCAG
jgi:sulfur-oxidizing protein SoxY